jgi:putative ABC transport system permease protein
MPWTRVFHRSRWDDERARELEAHLAIETDDNIARGMSPSAARDAARRKLGNPTLVREEIYHMNTVTLVDSAWRDLKYGARLLRLNPVFAGVAILSLALGVGANTAIFQLLDAVRLRTLPVADPQQLMEIRISDSSGGRTGQFISRRPNLSNPLWEQIRDRQQAFSSAFVWSTTDFDLTTGGEARYAAGLWVSGEYFNTLGVRPIAGRMLAAADDRRGCDAPPAVISYGFWQREYGGSPSAVGRSVRLNGHAFDIVGVTPPAFFGVEVGRSYDVAVPLCAEPLTRSGRSAMDRSDVWFLAAFGRLNPGWTREKATAHLAAISPPIFQTTVPTRYSAEDAHRYLGFKLGAFEAGTGVSTLRRDYESPLWLLLATTGLVLLIACGNLANLMLARATSREREIAVRLAIGASRGRIVRQLLAESVLIAVVGSVLGAVIAQSLSRFLIEFLTSAKNRVFVDLALDWRVFAFTAALAGTTCLLFGLLPALRATGIAPGAAMKAGSRGSTDTRERFGMRRALVVGQVALSLVLVVGALLFVRSLRNLMTLDAGFDQEGIVVANLDFRHAGIATERRTAVYADLRRRVAALPGVISAAQADIVPVSGSGWNNFILIDGVKLKETVNFNSVSDGYFKTMGTPILAGRDFDARDTPGAEKSVIVSELFAKKYFAGKNPIGQVFQIQEPPGQPRPLNRIIGLVKDTKYTDLREAFTPIGFYAASQDADPSPDIQLVVRTTAPLVTTTAEISAAATQVHPSASVRFQTMTTMVRDSLLRERLMATLSGFFGGLAALLATIGLYGVMSYMVARRRNEIGIRMALGAGRRDVLVMVMREAGLLLAGGVIVGALLAIAAARAATTLLFGLRPGDPATLGMAIAGLGMVAMLASYLPALRASRLEPTEALREE